MILSVTCQCCGMILSTIEKSQITQEDISFYQQNSFCNCIQPDGVTPDGNNYIQVTMVKEMQTMAPSMS